jgi:hypothetical protein
MGRRRKGRGLQHVEVVVPPSGHPTLGARGWGGVGLAAAACHPDGSQAGCVVTRSHAVA